MRRWQRSKQRASVTKWVDSRLDSLECEEVYSVPRIFVLAAESLAPGLLLSLVARWSDQVAAETGSPWVYRPLQEWINHTGLLEPDWIEARDRLRELGLIAERRRFDLDAGRIVVEIAFIHEAFAKRIAAVREEIAAQAWQRISAGEEL
jgi:hypothetical protein